MSIRRHARMMRIVEQEQLLSQRAAAEAEQAHLRHQLLVERLHAQRMTPEARNGYVLAAHGALTARVHAALEQAVARLEALETTRDDAQRDVQRANAKVDMLEDRGAASRREQDQLVLARQAEELLLRKRRSRR